MIGQIIIMRRPNKVLVYIFGLFFISCCFLYCRIENSNNKNENSNATISITVSENSNPFDVKAWIKHIRFVPLQMQKIRIGARPDKFKIQKDRILYSYVSSSVSVLNSYSLTGLPITQYIAHQDDANRIENINDFQLVGDTLMLLQADRISFFNSDVPVKLKQDLLLSQYYNAFFIQQNQFILYSSMTEYALDFLGLDGQSLKQEISQKEIPRLRGSRFPHFTENLSSGFHFYNRYYPRIYYFDDKNQLAQIVTLELGKNALKEDELQSILNAGDESLKLDRKFCNEEGRFCAFLNIVSLPKERLFICFKMNGNTYYGMADPKNKKGDWGNGVNNNSGIPFLVNSFNGLEIVGGYGNNIVICINVEQIERTQSSHVKPNIDSNWDQIKNQISDSTEVVLAFLELK
jgi:hypothetical protein